MNEAVVRTDGALVVPAALSPEFSWRAVIAGAFVGSAAIFFLLFLGAGVGLSLFSVPQADAGTASKGITLGAIYFFTAQGFGVAVGGYVAGRLMGPVLESRNEEIFHSSTHGLVSWALAVLMTATMVAVSGLALAGPGMNAAAILGTSSQTNQRSASSSDTNGYWVDMLFRPADATPSPVSATVSAAPATPVQISRSEADARAEAGRILTVGLLRAEKLSKDDHDYLVSLVSRIAGVDMAEAARRVNDVQNRMHQEVVAAAEGARRLTRFISLWLAASLIFGALAASAAAVTGRWVDDEARMQPA
jgi:hypothetical protein